MTKLRPTPQRLPVQRRAPGAGFTLIELLVVIAVISLLAAFLGVAVMGARNKAQVEAAKGLINRISTGLSVYQGRYSAYPPSDTTAPPAGDGAAAFGYGITAGSAAAVDPTRNFGEAYNRSAYLNFYLGAILYTFEGFRGGIPTVRKHNEPCVDIKLSELDGPDGGKNPKFAIITFGPLGLPNNPRINYTALTAGSLRRIIDPWGNPIGFRGPQPATGGPAATRAQDHTGWLRKQGVGAPATTAAARSSADNRRSFDIWSLGADGRGGPSGTDCNTAPQPETTPLNPNIPSDPGGGAGSQTSTWDDINNWLP